MAPVADAFLCISISSIAPVNTDNVWLFLMQFFPIPADEVWPWDPASGLGSDLPTVSAVVCMTESWCWTSQTAPAARPVYQCSARSNASRRFTLSRRSDCSETLPTKVCWRVQPPASAQLVKIPILLKTVPRCHCCDSNLTTTKQLIWFIYPCPGGMKGWVVGGWFRGGLPVLRLYPIKIVITW